MRWGLMQVGWPFLCLTAEGLESAPKPGIDLGSLREKAVHPDTTPHTQACITVHPDLLPNQKPS